MPTVFVAAGSNLDPVPNLKIALAELKRQFGPLTISRAYRNRAFGFAGPDFVNLAVRFDTELGLHALTARLHEIERLCGRERRAPKWASRAMDLDVLLYGDLVHEEPGLKLPRPCLIEQAYMLGPMAEIAAGLRHPVVGATLAQLWSEYDQETHPLEPIDLT